MNHPLLSGLVALSAVYVSRGIDWADVLRAEMTCCSNYMNVEDCAAETTVDCDWIADSPDPILQAVYNENGYPCVGSGYVACKQANGASACCSPGCSANPPGPVPPGGPSATPSPIDVCSVSGQPITPHPTHDTPAPTPSTPAPSHQTPAPTPSTPAPSHQTPAPTPGTPAPSHQTPAPTPSTPAPSHQTPAPTPSTPAPSHQTPAPTPSTPAPTPSTPAPTHMTPAPTNNPTAEMCRVGHNYNFEGIACQISGDPHTTTHNGFKHDFQGQPLTVTHPGGPTQNSFYYVHHCHGHSIQSLPFNIMATHFHWGTRDVSGVDFLTLELFVDETTIFFVYFSSQIHAVAKKQTGVTKDWDDTLSNELDGTIPASTIKYLPDNIWEVHGGRFELLYKDISSNSASLTIRIDANDQVPDNNGEIYLFMKGQMDFKTDVSPTRQRMHYVYFKQDSLYKCAACGLCGDFQTQKTSSSRHLLETCDGRQVEIRPGWNQAHTPEAYDIWGWTWEYNFVQDNCGTNYDIRNNANGLIYTDPCDPDIAAAVKAKCEDERNGDRVDTCCSNTLGPTTCNNMLHDCEFDACVVATDNGGTTQAIADAVRQLLTEPIEDACNIPGIQEALDENNAELAPVVGCFADSQDVNNRAMEFTFDMRIEHNNKPECFDGCKANGYRYAGLQYNRECFCSNSLADTSAYGDRWHNGPLFSDRGNGVYGRDQCYLFPDGSVPCYHSLSCLKDAWGGHWTYVVHDLVNYPAPPQVLAAESSHRIRDRQQLHRSKQQQEKQEQQRMYHKLDVMKVVQREQDMQGTEMYIKFAAAAGLFALCGAAVYRYRRSKDGDKYLPIKDPLQV